VHELGQVLFFFRKARLQVPHQICEQRDQPALLVLAKLLLSLGQQTRCVLQVIGKLPQMLSDLVVRRCLSAVLSASVIHKSVQFVGGVRFLCRRRTFQNHPCTTIALVHRSPFVYLQNLLFLGNVTGAELRNRAPPFQFETLKLPWSVHNARRPSTTVPYRHFLPATKIRPTICMLHVKSVKWVGCY
jgi:hypothetical protein